MKVKYLAIIASFLSIAPFIYIHQTVGQNSTNSKEQKAIEIASKKLKVPANELRVVATADIEGVTRFKVLEVTTGKFESVNLNQYNDEVTKQEVEEILGKKRSKQFKGKLEAGLADKINSGSFTGSNSVVVWVKTSQAPPKIERNDAESQENKAQVETFKKFHKDSTEKIKKFIEQKGGIVEYVSENAPLVIAKNLHSDSIKALEKQAEIDSIQEGQQYKPDLNIAVPAIDANTVQARGITGTGVRVAVVENSGIYFAHNNLADGSYCNSLSSSPVGNHSTAVAGTIASTNATFRGAAPGVPALLSGNTIGFTDAEVIKCTDWAINNGAKVINYSFSVDSSSSLVALDRYVDYVIRNRFVTLTKSAGNIGSTCFGANYVTSPGKGWNMLTVGSYDDRGTVNNSDDIMSSFSCYEDPSSPNGDRQKPDVAAPGSNVTTTCSGSPTCFAPISGTSFSTPITAGCAALLMQRNAVLQSWPESIRAVLMASAVVNLEGSTRLSEFDGAGGIECDSADDVVRGAAGLEARGTFVKTDFPRTYTFSANAGQTVRVAIAWNSDTNTTYPITTDVLKAGLDLTVNSPTGTSVATSASYDNSYEIVEFTAPTTGTYTARINAFRFDGSSEYLGFAVWRGTREKN